ncbi:hypothetical protein EAG71_09080 [Campylobacter jejuni]|nr:hypothetical protein [Campylobacter jejuni]
MTDGFGFLAYVFTLPVLILGGISYVCIVFLIRFQSFCGFVCSKSFWIAWLFSYYLLFLIICITCEWELLIMYICGISLPLVYFLRKFFMQLYSNLALNEFSLWIIPMSIFSLCIHSSLCVAIAWMLIFFQTNYDTQTLQSWLRFLFI